MQNVQNCQIIYLTNGLKIIFVETNFTPKNIINSKKKKKKKKKEKNADRDRNWLIAQKQLIYISLSRARIRKLPVHVHTTHVVKIDILTGH